MTDDLPDHTNYSLIKATDESGNIVTVLVDASGRMYAVMKGDYAGALKTLALDDRGRIQAVLTDPEDVFGNPNYIGAGELAARLGSIKHYEKRGEVLFMDDFEDSTFKWYVAGTGTGWAVSRSSQYALSGDYSVKLVTGDAATNFAYMRYYSYPPVMKRVGFEYSFALGNNLRNLYGTIEVYDGTYKYEARFIYAITDQKLQVINEAGGYTDLATSFQLKEELTLFHTWKQVIDLETIKYSRCFLDNVDYPVSTIGFKRTADAGLPHVALFVTIDTETAANNYAYIDNVIFTQNEP